MQTSDADEIVKLYEPTADAYSSMMDSEILLPVYRQTLSRLHQKVEQVPGPIVDIACGSGHMLALYAENYGAARELIGIDLTPGMVQLTKDRLGDAGVARVGDMRRLPDLSDGSVAALLNFFAIHHLEKEELKPAIAEWRRLLAPGGQLILAAWEGTGQIDYGDDSHLIAFKYSQIELGELLSANGFSVDRCTVDYIAEMSMNAVYIDATCG